MIRYNLLSILVLLLISCSNQSSKESAESGQKPLQVNSIVSSNSDEYHLSIFHSKTKAINLKSEIKSPMLLGDVLIQANHYILEKRKDSLIEVKTFQAVDEAIRFIEKASLNENTRFKIMGKDYSLYGITMGNGNSLMFFGSDVVFYLCPKNQLRFAIVKYAHKKEYEMSAIGCLYFLNESLVPLSGLKRVSPTQSDYVIEEYLYSLSKSDDFFAISFDGQGNMDHLFLESPEILKKRLTREQTSGGDTVSFPNGGAFYHLPLWTEIGTMYPFN